MVSCRRSFLRGAGIALLTGVSPALVKPAFANFAEGKSRSLAFDNLHTGEKLKVDYWAEGEYIPGALSEIDRVLRDFRTGEVHQIEPKLLDLLALLRARLETIEPLPVISGYRSPKTNAALHEASSGVASNSLHMQGMAIDIRVPGRALAAVRTAALDMRVGGVGYYPKSNFVHVDVGRVRRW